MQAAPSVRRTVLRGIWVVLGLAVIGAIIGVFTPAHMEIAGSEAAIQLHPGRAYDEVALSGNVLTGKRATARAFLGEPLGVTIRLDLDPSTFVTPDGSFNADVVPAYVQAYSDPEQLGKDVGWAVAKHLLLWIEAGAIVGGLVVTGYQARQWWRRRQLDQLSGRQRRTAHWVWSRDGTLRRRTATAVVLAFVLLSLPSAAGRHRSPPRIVGDPILASTPLAGTQVGGLLSPALGALQKYIETYFAETDSYYDQLRDKVLATAAEERIGLPGGSNVVHLMFVTDRHCNIGMDRVIVALAQHFDIKLLVSGGDDDFSGSFPFESACTENLAAKSQQAGMTDVFVSGNHDSAMTRTDEAKQHIKVLDDNVISAGGLTFIGIHDPRRSRYGQGIVPSALPAQFRLLRIQGDAAGKLACQATAPVIAVLHDPRAGAAAIRTGCHKVTLALDGHTHLQIGPTRIGTAHGVIAYRFVGGSTGGAPGEGTVERSFASQLTVGPLNHDASMNIVSVNQVSGALIGVTVCHMTPDQTVTFQQLTTDN